MEDNSAHFILTRFNCGLYSNDYVFWNFYKKPDPELWMEKRLNLFETYCIPSVKRQNCKNFEWIVLFDDKTPDKYRKRMEDYCDVCEPLFSDFKGLATRVKEKAKDVETIITTRIDNDDEMLPNFIKIIQDNKSKSEKFPFFINLYNGFKRNLKNNVISDYDNKSNMFISVIEKTKDSKTIYEYGDHTQLRKYGKIIDIEVKDCGFIMFIIVM